MPRMKKRLYRSVQLSKALKAAIGRYGESPSPAARKTLESMIKRFADRRKYDGEFLTPARASVNKRSPRKAGAGRARSTSTI